MRKLEMFVLYKPIDARPLGGASSMHTLLVGRDGCESIEETDTGNVLVTVKSGNERKQFLFTIFGYSRVAMKEAKV